MPASKRRRRRIAHNQRVLEKVRKQLDNDEQKENISPQNGSGSSNLSPQEASRRPECNVVGDLNDNGDTLSYWDSISTLTNGISQVKTIFYKVSSTC